MVAAKVVELEAWQLLIAWMTRVGITRADLSRILGVSRDRIHAWCHGRKGVRRHDRPRPDARWRLEQISDRAVRATDWATPAELKRFEAIVRLEAQSTQLLMRGKPLLIARRKRLTWRDKEIYNAFCALGRVPPGRILWMYRRAFPSNRKSLPRAGKR